MCTGNAARSVMAENLFRVITQDQGLPFLAESAGIKAPEGALATPETVKILGEEGIDATGHKSRRVTRQMIEEADRILIMEKAHRDELLKLEPQSAPKIELLTSFSSDLERVKAGCDVADPVFMSETFYKNICDVVKDCVRGFIKRL